jgi:hypothetical protein
MVAHIIAIQEVEIGGLWLKASLGKKIRQILSQKQVNHGGTCL